MVRQAAAVLSRLFDICRLRAETDDGTSRIVVLQHDHVQDVGTKLVAPLVAEARIERVSRLHVGVVHNGEPMILAVELAAAIPVRAIGMSEGSARQHRDAITAALDLLFFGF